MLGPFMEVFMATDTERNYQGTNFAVVTLIVLLVLVGGYFAVSHIDDVFDTSTMPAVDSDTPVDNTAVNPGAL